MKQQIKKILKVLFRKYKMVYSLKDTDNIIFCFAGELGYELISWLPYLQYLKNTLKFKITTCSRPGSAIFYEFSDKHLEYSAPLQGEMWGAPVNYKKIAKELNLDGKKMVYPVTLFEKPNLINQTIEIAGCPWTVRDIHKNIDNTSCYAKLDYSNINTALPFAFDRPFVVINNKYYCQWNMTKPVNCFHINELETLRAYLISKGYAVVYNHFRDNHTSDLELKDQKIFGRDPFSFDLTSWYKNITDINLKNKMQLAIYNQAAFVIAPQGGNVYLPAICKKNIYLLMQRGEYNDYLELARLYNVKINAFYEVPHMLAWMKNTL